MGQLAKKTRTSSLESWLTGLCFFVACAILLLALLQTASANPAHPVSVAIKRISVNFSLQKQPKESACIRDDICPRVERLTHHIRERFG